MEIHFVPMSDVDREYAGLRDTSGRPLSDEEIQYVLSEIVRIDADTSKFLFNDPSHVRLSTCYNFQKDLIFVTRNVFPDNQYGSTHPRDLMSVGAVLAHEYYGHRTYRAEYIADWSVGKDYHSTPIWEDECRASVTAAKIAPGLSRIDRSNLLLDAMYRAQEYGQVIELDDYMRRVLYGYSDDERCFTGAIEPLRFVSIESVLGTDGQWQHNRCLSEMSDEADLDNDIER